MTDPKAEAVLKAFGQPTKPAWDDCSALSFLLFLDRGSGGKVYEVRLPAPKDKDDYDNCKDVVALKQKSTEALIDAVKETNELVTYELYFTFSPIEDNRDAVKLTVRFLWDLEIPIHQGVCGTSIVLRPSDSWIRNNSEGLPLRG